MATNTLSMPYYLAQTKNVKSPVNGRWFAYVKHMGCLSTRGLANHMIEHGLIANRGELIKTLSMLSECIPELVAQGYSVKLDGLGIFAPTIANNKGGAESAAEFSVSQNIKGVRFGFRPDSTDLDDLTTKAFGKRVSFGPGFYRNDAGAEAPYFPLAAAEEPEP